MPETEKFVSVTRDVVEAFLSALEQTNVNSDVTEKLRVTLLEKAKVSEKDLRQALFPNDNAP